MHIRVCMLFIIDVGAFRSPQFAFLRTCWQLKPAFVGGIVTVYWTFNSKC